MTDKEKVQLKYVKDCFSVAKSDSERRQMFMMFATDLTYPRWIICQAMKELCINNDMSLSSPQCETTYKPDKKGKEYEIKL